jgi:uncharacterized protein YndB with AHSA1/START domain
MTNTEIGDGVLGSLSCVDGKGVLRIEDRFAAGIDDAWSALTEPSRLARWYGEVEGDLKEGGTYSARLHASGWEGTGRVEVCEPPGRLAVVSRGSDAPHEQSTEVSLTAEGAETVVVVEQRGLPLELLWAYAAGMQIHVEDLGDHLAGRERRDAMPRFDQLGPAYQALETKAG